MAGLTVGELTGLIRADDSGMRRGLNDAELRMRGFQRDVEGRLRHLDGRFATLGEQIAAGLRTGTNEGRRFGVSLRGLVGMAGRLGGLAASIGGIAAKLGAAVPLAAGLAAAVGNIAPAAGVAATGLFAVVLASNAVKLGMVGVGDAVKAALDPSDPEAFAEALKKLSPNAREFAQEVRALAPQFKDLQQGVQNALFKDFGQLVRDLGEHTLPIFKKQLTEAATTLNYMGKSVANAALDLSLNGTLGKALHGANQGLSNLTQIPGQLVTALVQVGAAAAPSFAKLTAAAGGAFDKLAEKMQKAFDNGAMQRAIERAISLIGELAEVAGNVFQIIGSVFGAAQVSGGGFLGVLQEITGRMADAFASPEVQGGLKAIFGVMAQLAKSVGPILVSLLKTIGRVFKVLGPPVEELVKHLGAGLLKIADALGPVLVEVAKAVGELVKAALPLVDLAGDLIAQALPALTPLFAALGETIRAAAPFVAALAKAAGEMLMPILRALVVDVLPKLLPPFIDLVNRIFPILTDVLIRLTPSLAKLGVAIAGLLVELAPVIVAVLELQVALLDKLMPVIGPIIDLMTKLTNGALAALTGFITRYVVPAVKALGALLRGDFSGAVNHAKTIARNFATDALRSFLGLRDRAGSAMTQLGQAVSSKASAMGQALVRSISQKINETVAYFRGLPGKIRSALGNAGSLLYGIGQAIVRGLINGVKSMIGALRAEFASITNQIPDWKGPAETDARLLTPAGRSVIAGFQRGIAAQVPALQQQLQGITTSLPGMAMGTVAAGAYAGAGMGGGQQRVIVEFRGPDAMRDLIRDIVRVDGRGSTETTFGR